MKRTSLVVAGFSAIVAFGLIGYGCTSGDTVTSGTGGQTTSGTGGQTTSGTGGQTTSGTGGQTTSGTGGMTTTGTGGMTTTGTGGMTTTGTGGATGGLLMCASTLKDKAACTSTDMPCNKNCGVNASGAGQPRATKPCACIASTVTPPMAWDCTNSGACTYPTTFDKTCFSLTPAPAACPTTLITTNVTTCTNTAGATCGPICGSATVNSYQDSSMAAKMGYCACINGVYQCASAKEWPM